MTQREKVLAGCLVGAIVSYGGYKLGKSRVYEPRQRVVQEISDERSRLEKLEVRLNGVGKILRDWQKQTSRTLGLDASAAHQAFREDVALLLERNNLTKIEGWTISKHKERVEKKSVREGFVELPLAVHVTGTLDDLVNFLKGFYQRPYPVRVDTLSLSAQGGSSPRSRKDRDAADGPLLSINMTLSTLVLPKVEGLEHPTMDLTAMDNPESQPLIALVPRLDQEDPTAYNEIARLNPFRLYEPQTPVASEPLATKTEVPRVVEPPPPPPPPRDPRPDAHKFVLEGTGWLNDGPIAYVVHTDQTTAPPTGYRLNEGADDGKVVLIVPQGIVVRVVPDGSRPGPVRNYFYPLGQSFKDREEVNPADHPEVERLLRSVLER